MSTLWTPGGERPIRREPEQEPSRAPEEELSDEEVRARMDELRDQLARTPAEVVIANHAFGLFELAALHLSLSPPQLDQARLAIDALNALVEGLGSRLGEASKQLVDGLAQLRMAFVQIHAAQGAGGGAGAGSGEGEEGAGEAGVAGAGAGGGEATPADPGREPNPPDVGGAGG